MKAAIVTRFGSRWSIKVGAVPKPSPASREILVRVRAATVNRTDCGELLHPLLQRIIVRGQPRRSILGMDFAGEIEVIGDEVSAWRPGDRVFGMSPWGRSGGQAEYICLPETAPVSLIPQAVPFDHAICPERSGKLNMPFLLWSAITRSGRASVPLPPRGGAQNFVRLLSEHMEAGQFRAVVDRSYSLDQISDAYRYVLTGQKAGIVVIDV